MGETTAIAWTDHTFNPWWGCTNVSPGCDHCYAETFAKRTGHDVWGKGGARRFFGDKHWAEPFKWNRQAEAEGVRRRVFCASMADVFERRDDLEDARSQLWDVVGDTPWLDWQLLTKRPENVLDMVPSDWLGGVEEWSGIWPENVWIGTTVEDQQRAAIRLPRLVRVRAAVLFLSCEPLLGPVNLVPWLEDIDWVIVGGESGPKHRPLNLEHARSVQRQCALWDTPFFFKQVGGRTPKAGGDTLDGVEWKQFPEAVPAR